MSFKSIFNAFRTSAKPGVKRLNNQDPNNPRVGPLYGDNENADPLCDPTGCQWIRDASDPQAFLDPQNANSSSVAYPEAQVWDFFPNFLVAPDFTYYLGVYGAGQYAALAIYNIVAIANATVDGAGTPWLDYPLYLQIFTPNNGVEPVNGANPDFCMPIPRAPDCAKWTFGVKTPFNCVAALEGGAAICLSTTPAVYTKPDAGAAIYTFELNVNWAFYSRTSA
jgi:hypothetical protein